MEKSTAAPAQNAQRRREDAQNTGLDCADRAAAQPEPQAETAEHGRDGKNPQSAPPGVEGEQEQAEQIEQAVDQIGQRGGQPAAPQRTQQVVDQAVAQAAGNCQKQLPELHMNRKLHQPKSLRSLPPVGADS